jgi:hypothetical protein
MSDCATQTYCKSIQRDSCLDDTLKECKEYQHYVAQPQIDIDYNVYNKWGIVTWKKQLQHSMTI